ISEHLDRRHELSMQQYDSLLEKSRALKFGTRNLLADTEFVPQARSALSKPTLVLKRINEFHREYEWVS
ncbi:MAG: 3-hydroxy-3-methylglutaryl-ACP synthase, partial [Steroidobacteraceae bacterium]